MNAIIGSIAYATLHGFEGFLLAEFFFSIALASISGADTAAIWDTYLADDDQPSAEKIIATGKIVFLGSAVFLTIIGGILASYNLTAPLYVSIAGALLNVILYGKSYEVKRERIESAKLAWIETLKMFKVTKFKEAFLLGVISATVLRIAFWAYIPKLGDYDVDPVWFGFVLAGANVVAVVTTYMIGSRDTNGTKLTLVSIIISVIGVTLFAMDNALWVVIFAIVLHQVGLALIGVIIPIKINQATKSDIRASAISLMSMMTGLVYFIVTVLFDLLAMLRYQIMIVNAIISIVVLIIWIFHKLRIDSSIDISKPVQLSS